jgi:hypothetical protein
MNIAGVIQQAKNKFNEARIKNIKRKTVNLTEEKLRAGKLAQANAEYQKQQRDTQAIKEYNQKVEATRPNLLKNLGNTLVNVTNKANTTLKKIDKQNKGSMKKGKTRISGSTGFSITGQQTELNYGANNGSPFGSNMETKSSPFTFGAETNKKKKNPFEF